MLETIRNPTIIAKGFFSRTTDHSTRVTITAYGCRERREAIAIGSELRSPASFPNPARRARVLSREREHGYFQPRDSNPANTSRTQSDSASVRMSERGANSLAFRSSYSHAPSRLYFVSPYGGTKGTLRGPIQANPMPRGCHVTFKATCGQRMPTRYMSDVGVAGAARTVRCAPS